MSVPRNTVSVHHDRITGLSNAIQLCRHPVHFFASMSRSAVLFEPMQARRKNEMAYAALEGTQNSTYELAFSSSSAGVLPRCQVDAHFRNQLKTSSGNPSAVGTSVDFSGPCLHYLGHNKSHFFIY